MSVDVLSFDLQSPDDLSVLRQELSRCGPQNVRRLALLMRVAGEYTDGSRERARAAIEALLQEMDLADRTEFVTVIGAEGASTPCGYALIDTSIAQSHKAAGEVRLSMGLARAVPPAEPSFGSAAFARQVAAVVAAGVRDGSMRPNDVELVIVNVPQATSGDAALRARQARAAAALGAGLALGTIEDAAVTDARILQDAQLYTSRVQTFTGPAIRNLEVIVLGNVAGADGNFLACNVVTTDLLDTRAIKRMLRNAGLRIDADGEIDTARLAATIAKLGVDPSGVVGGAPTTIFTSAMAPEKHVRAALSGVLGAVLHTTRVFSTYDPVQQAPLGGGTICCILRAP